MASILALNRCPGLVDHYNVPKAMAKVRLDTYAEYAWPRAMGKLYQRNGLTLALASGAGLALFLCLTLMLMGNLFTVVPGGDFYRIFPHNTLALMFGSVFGFAVLALTLGVRRFWRNVSPPAAPVPLKSSAALEATANVATLKYLDGGHGEGCNNADDRFTLWRRRFHHFTFYGFMLCFAATGVATLFHYLLKWPAPYPIFSVPVILGIAGGIGLLIGPAGLLWLNLRRDPAHGDEKQKPMDRGFIALLFLVSASGLALLALRDTSALGAMLALHLGLVMAFFLTMPYSKFAHGIFRSAALLKHAIEKRQPNPIDAAGD
ncbi:tricarballylate utilization 4Fe-4S protein TcuB, partial [Pseudomonas kuykendallii]|uniref:tricarballylate utilization 4Fe-4S protein TcuB n=1 Tax=Pseudomonas kuykendallii TaxID=1007099 RepID=UPI0028CFE120